MDSYPPRLLRLPGSAPGSPARGVLEGGRPAPALVPAAPVADQPAAVQPEPVPVQPEPVPVPDDGMAGQQDLPPVLLAGPGQPGSYAPAVTPQTRPHNVTELGRRVTPATPEPWPAGAYVPVGQSGKRAHWTGSSWKGGVSPGYGAELVRSVTEQTTGGEQ